MTNRYMSNKLLSRLSTVCISVLFVTSCVMNDADNKSNILSIGIPTYLDSIEWGISYEDCLEQGIIKDDLTEVSKAQIYSTQLLNSSSFLGSETWEVYLGFRPKYDYEMNHILEIHDIKPFGNDFYLDEIYFCLDMGIDEAFSLISTKINGIELTENTSGEYYRWESSEKIANIGSYSEKCADIYNWLYDAGERDKGINAMSLYQNDGKAVVCIHGNEAVVANYICSS